MRVEVRRVLPEVLRVLPEVRRLSGRQRNPLHVGYMTPLTVTDIRIWRTFIEYYDWTKGTYYVVRLKFVLHLLRT